MTDRERDTVAPISSGITPRSFVQGMWRTNQTFAMDDQETRQWASMAGLVGDVNVRSRQVKARAAVAKASYLSDLLGEDWGAVALAWNMGVEEAWTMQAQGHDIESYLQKNPQARSRMGSMDWGSVLNFAADTDKLGTPPHWDLPKPPANVTPNTGSLPRQIYDYLTVTHQVSPETALGILANIQAESNFVTSAVGDNGTSFGLFQHHKGRASAMKQHAASRGVHWTDWRAQVDYAMIEARAMKGWNPKATDPREASRWWTIYFERPANAQQKAGQRADLVASFQHLVDQSSGLTASQQAWADRYSAQIPERTPASVDLSDTVFDPNSQPGTETYDPNKELGLYTLAAMKRQAKANTPQPGSGSALSNVLRGLSNIVRSGAETPMSTASPEDTMTNDVQVQ